jgi:5-keto 4-deoxyuronate isomerase
VLVAITIATPPARAYKYGETFSKEDIVVQATYNNGSTDENFTDYTVDKTGSLTMSDTVITLTANENAEIQTMLNITVDKADVINSGGSATVAYTGASYDLEMIDGLFTVDPNAGAVIFTSTDWPKAAPKMRCIPLTSACTPGQQVRKYSPGLATA